MYFTIKSIISKSRLLVCMTYNASSKGKLKLYQIFLVCDNWVYCLDS